MLSLSLRIPVSEVEAFEARTEHLLACLSMEVALAGPDYHQVDVIVSLDNLPQLKGLMRKNFPGIKVVKETPINMETNWLEENFKAFPPSDIGRFCIYGSHIAKAPDHLPHTLCVDAATAFGSGEHGTTQGCILTMENLQHDGPAPAHILDLGCGSGILALAAKKLWPGSLVLASDNDPEAIRVTAHHARLNKIPIETTVAQGFEAPAFNKRRFDLIVANILANPLISLAPALVAHLEPEATVILSGLLIDQAPAVTQAYEAQGLTLKTQKAMGGWVTLLFKRASNPRP